MNKNILGKRLIVHAELVLRKWRVKDYRLRKILFPAYIAK